MEHDSIAVKNEREQGSNNPPVNRLAGAAGEALSAGPTVKEDANGDRRVVSSSPAAENANAESSQHQQAE